MPNKWSAVAGGKPTPSAVPSAISAQAGSPRAKRRGRGTVVNRVDVGTQPRVGGDCVRQERASVVCERAMVAYEPFPSKRPPSTYAATQNMTWGPHS